MIRARENLVGAWAFSIGATLAVIVGIIAAFSEKVTIDPLILGILAVIGIIVAYFVAEKDVSTFLLASISVVIVSFAGIQGLVINSAVLGVDISKIITSILGALLFLFIPATIIVALKTVFSIAKS